MAWSGPSPVATGMAGAIPLPRCRSNIVPCNFTMTIWSTLVGPMTSSLHCLIRSRAASMRSDSKPGEASPIFPCSCGRSRERRRQFCSWPLLTPTWRTATITSPRSTSRRSCRTPRWCRPTSSISFPIRNPDAPATTRIPTARRCAIPAADDRCLTCVQAFRIG